jgi:hypothetical protein
LANRTDFAISRPAVGKVRWRRNSFAGFTCARLIWTLPLCHGLTAQAHRLPQGLHLGTGLALPSWLDRARAQGQLRWSECWPTLGTVRPKPPVCEVPRLPAGLPSSSLARKVEGEGTVCATESSSLACERKCSSERPRGRPALYPQVLSEFIPP